MYTASMINEQIIRQAVMNTINQAGCTGVEHVCWGLCEHTATPKIPNENTKYSAEREKEIFTNRVMHHVRAIQHEQQEAKRWKSMIPVDLDKVEESYADGLETGKNWTRNYVPGGPWYWIAADHDQDRNKATSMQLQAEHYAWMQGFYDGYSNTVDKPLKGWYPR
jgi:hypothetical protein